MRIGIDGRLVRYRRGMGNQIFNLLQGLAALRTRHDFVIYLDQPPESGSIPEALASTVRVLAPGSYPVWEQVALPRQVRRDGVQVLHCPNSTAPIVQLGQARLVLTVHDAMFLLPRDLVPTPTDLYQRLGRQYRRWVVPRAVRRADRILTFSAHAKADLVRHLRLEEDRVTVVSAGPGSQFHRLSDPSESDATLDRYAIRRPYVLGLAAWDPRKNVSALIRAFAKLQEEIGGFQLVLSGSGPKDSARWRAEANQLNLENDVALPGFVSPAELAHLYNAAVFFVFPSLYEGFGLPVLEAMACGTPVVASTRSSIPEVAGTAALLAEPTAEGLAAAMVLLARDDAQRQRLSRAGLERAATFSLTGAALEMLSVYEGKR
jgi:glycosyltransferase involved in cell wall biosynthesis